jgi:phosphoribosylanthranilate isomerase
LPAPTRRTKPLVLAGGLNDSNVAAAIAQVRPFAVDVSSGVESAPGVKSAERLQQFCAAVRAADQKVHSEPAT